MKRIVEKNPKRLELIDPVNGIWAVRWNIKSIDESQDSCEQINFNHKPSAQEIKKALVEGINEICSKNIVHNFTWKGNPVYLNKENQSNFTLICNAANIDNTILPVTLKFGTEDEVEYYEFQNLTDLNSFYVEMSKHIASCLKECWELKQNINLEDYK